MGFAFFSHTAWNKSTVFNHSLLSSNKEAAAIAGPIPVALTWIPLCPSPILAFIILPAWILTPMKIIRSIIPIFRTQLGAHWDPFSIQVFFDPIKPGFCKGSALFNAFNCKMIMIIAYLWECSDLRPRFLSKLGNFEHVGQLWAIFCKLSNFEHIAHFLANQAIPEF